MEYQIIKELSTQGRVQWKEPQLLVGCRKSIHGMEIILLKAARGHKTPNQLSSHVGSIVQNMYEESLVKWGWTLERKVSLYGIAKSERFYSYLTFEGSNKGNHHFRPIANRVCLVISSQ